MPSGTQEITGPYLALCKQTGQLPQNPGQLKTTGKAWHQRTRYGRFIGQHPQENETLTRALSRENESVNHIKVINSGLNTLSVFGLEAAPQFSLAELKEVVKFARQQGKKTMVHANGKLLVQIAIEAGCDSVEHGFFMGRKNLQRMADTCITWVPTACTMEALARNIPDNDPNIDRRIIKQTLEHQLQQMARAKEHGVTVALGTDAGSLGVCHRQ